ncbi:DUF3078 domain-containing protein [candidate division KSB1 bacterium]
MNRTALFLIILLSGIFCADVSGLYAQAGADSLQAEWDNIMRLRFYMNHVFLENWTQGGDEVFNWRADIENTFTRESETTSWDNLVKIRYAQNNVGSGSDIERRITENQIDMRSDIILKRTGTVNPFLGGTLKTQITRGYKYEKDKPREARSDFWDPVTLTQNFGMDISGIKYTKVRLSVDYQEKIAETYYGFYKIDDPSTEKIEKHEITKGTTLWCQYRQQIGEKYSVYAELESRYNFMHYSEITVNLESTLDFAIVSFLNFSIQSFFRYDKSQSATRQLRNIAGLTFIFDLFQ